MIVAVEASSGGVWGVLAVSGVGSLAEWWEKPEKMQQVFGRSRHVLFYPSSGLKWGIQVRMLPESSASDVGF